MKILVSDIDSSMFTLENKEFKESIREFTARGHIFIIATSKAINYVADYLALTDINIEYYICNDGAVIFDHYFNVIYRKDLKSDVVRPIMNMLDSDDNILESFIDTSHGFAHDTIKCANGIVARAYDSVKAEILLNTICLKYPSIHGHISDNWLNIVDTDVNKAIALNYIKENYRLDKADVYILGKNIEDLELMESFNGYTMKDCCEDLKKYAKGEVNDLTELINILLKEEEEKEFEAIYA